jgi:hypothetical protein
MMQQSEKHTTENEEVIKNDGFLKVNGLPTLQNLQRKIQPQLCKVILPYPYHILWNIKNQTTKTV